MYLLRCAVPSSTSDLWSSQHVAVYYVVYEGPANCGVGDITVGDAGLCGAGRVYLHGHKPMTCCGACHDRSPVLRLPGAKTGSIPALEPAVQESCVVPRFPLRRLPFLFSPSPCFLARAMAINDCMSDLLASCSRVPQSLAGMSHTIQSFVELLGQAR